MNNDLIRKCERAKAVLDVYESLVGKDDGESLIVDLMADLLHLADSLGIDDYAAVVNRAVMHFEAERKT